MSDTITVKTENADNNDSNDSLDTLPDLTELLEEVKKEEQGLQSDAETQPENDEAEALPESFFDELYREELEADSTGATTDADIQKLQELIEKKKNLLKAQNQQRKRKDHNESNKDDENQENCSQAKRSRNDMDTHEEFLPSGNESPTRETIDSSSNNQQPASPAGGCLTTTDQANDAELELENLLKTEDYNSDEEPSAPNQGMTLRGNMQPTYPFQNAMPMVPSMYDPATNQMMGNTALGGYPMMFNMGMGFPPGFFPPNMMNMQMMGCGVPQMGVPSIQDEVQCLPVTNSLPSFKPIKLEKKSKARNEEREKEAASAEERKKRIFDACTHLLDKMEFAEPTGKFVYTSTVTKLNAAASNSILQNITNVSYNFQSIGPKLNLQDWGLKEISGKNAEVAKKICMSADKYFDKIVEKANTTARKLIKVENAKADRIQNETEMEVEDPSMSSFFKNSMTQTEALVCRECVARKRKVGHNIAVQASVFTGSIGSQTTPELNFGDQITEGLSENQLKAMYDFSKLIREPPKNTSTELYNLRENLINIYNLSQRQYKGPVPFVDTSSPQFGLVQSANSDPRRIETNPISDPRRFANSGMPNINIPPPAQMMMPQQNISNYSPHGMQIPNQQITSAQFPGSQINNYQYPPPIMHQNQAPQIPNQQRQHGYQGRATQFAGQPLPEIQNHEFPAGGPLQEGMKRYGRGAFRR